MKTIQYFIIIFMLNSYLLYSQNKGPEPLYFKIIYGKSTSYKPYNLNDSTNQNKQKHFQIGTQWGFHPKMAQALLFNSNMGYADVYYNNPQIPNPDTSKFLDYIFQHPYGIHHNSRGFAYKATNKICAGTFSPNTNDSEKMIFGFQVCNFSNSDTMKNALVLTTLKTWTNPVLSKPWISNRFYKIANDTVDQYGKNNFDYSGEHYIITVNLRRKDLDSIDNLKDTSRVLSIIIPYYLTSGTTSSPFIHFDALPSTSSYSMSYTYFDGSSSHTVTRGNCLLMQSSNSTTFTITRAMLPNLTDTLNGCSPDITISASFTCSTDPLSPNPPFKSIDGQSNTIDSIGCDVYYHGNSNILLNYIRIGNPASDKLWKGEYDVEYHNELQKNLDSLHSKGYNLYRFYGHDEIKAPELFNGFRYLNKLVGGLLVTEQENLRSPMEKYYLEATDLWLGGFGTVLGAPAPYYFNTIQERPYPGIFTCNYPHSYRIDNTGNIDFIKNSGYETYVTQPEQWNLLRGTIDYTNPFQ
ncbi:MAG: hypothetical protein NT007_00150 [Candidatus Kapabacteria bacterium]|nr:hypothetical protein [Candidatus Kapabacteria bacterium]